MIEDQMNTIKLLEKECRSLKSQSIKFQTDNQDLRHQIQQRTDSNNMRWQQLEEQHQSLIEHEQAKNQELLRILDEEKHHSKKKSAKVKGLKKERDSLRIEILKMKQMFSEKCDNYREGRQKLQKKVKKRDDKILYLE